MVDRKHKEVSEADRLLNFMRTYCRGHLQISQSSSNPSGATRGALFPIGNRAAIYPQSRSRAGGLSATNTLIRRLIRKLSLAAHADKTLSG